MNLEKRIEKSLDELEFERLQKLRSEIDPLESDEARNKYSWLSGQIDNIGKRLNVRQLREGKEKESKTGLWAAIITGATTVACTVAGIVSKRNNLKRAAKFEETGSFRTAWGKSSFNDSVR